MSKRYVLFTSDGALSEEDFREFGRILESRHGRLKLIAVKGNDRAVIVKSTNDVAPVMRESSGRLRVGGKTLTVVLTSGAVGKLKRAAQTAGTSGKHGEVP